MEDLKTLNEWLKVYRVKWADGMERIDKALMSRVTAQQHIDELKRQGVIMYE